MADFQGVVVASIGTAFYYFAFVEMRRLGRLEKELMQKQPGGHFAILLLILASLLFVLSVFGVLNYFLSSNSMREFPYAIYPILFVPVSAMFWKSVRSMRCRLEGMRKSDE